VKAQLRKSIREVPKFDKLLSHIDMTVTNEGLRIELTESATGTFFESGSAKMSGDGPWRSNWASCRIMWRSKGTRTPSLILLPPLIQTGSLIVQYREKPAGAAEKSAQGHGKQESTGGGEPAAPKKE
jgi:hypothetical protein